MIRDREIQDWLQDSKDLTLYTKLHNIYIQNHMEARGCDYISIQQKQQITTNNNVKKETSFWFFSKNGSMYNIPKVCSCGILGAYLWYFIHTLIFAVKQGMAHYVTSVFDMNSPFPGRSAKRIHYCTLLWEDLLWDLIGWKGCLWDRKKHVHLKGDTTDAS